MKIEEKLWPPEGEKGFKEIWPSDPVKLDQDIIKKKFLVKFHEDWSKTVASRGWTRCYEPGVTRKKWKWNQQQVLNY